jgi:hypothetical protein
MSYTAYTTHDMQQLVRVTREPDPFWLSNFFTKQINFDSEYIDFDVVDEGRRLAPFVAPTVQGKPIAKRGFTTKRFKPAYVKPKGIVDPSQLMTRIAGEAYTGTMTLAQRRDAVVAQMVREFRNRIIRRWEWMAAQAVQFASVTVAGDDYPTVTVSFGRDNSLTATKTSTAAWTHADSTPLDDLDGMIRTMRDLSGYGTQDIVMGTSAWAAFKVNADVVGLLETRRGSTSTAEIGPGQGKPFEYKGTFGELNVWVYSDKYENDSGVATNYMDPRDVVGVAKEGFQGHRCFGAILDSKAGYLPVDIFAKMWEENDPSAEILLLQSAPLMVPKQPNASFRIRAVE